jgi:hypothetical protein
LSTPSIGPRYGFPLLKIIISRNIYRMGTLIVNTSAKFTKRPLITLETM